MSAAHGRSLFIRREGGFTTPAAAIALLLVLSLLFMCVDGFRVGTRSGQIQYVADAGALAADSVVAEFVTAGQVIDAVLLSFSLFVVTVYAISIVASTVPGGQEVAGKLAAFGAKVVKARDKFAQSAVKGLASAQKALPALCAVRASEVVKANAEASGQEYHGVAIACPGKGATLDIVGDGSMEEQARKIEGELEHEREKMKKNAAERDASRKSAEKAKEEAWRADCGSNDENMRERAHALAHLSGAQNPDYATVDTWSFSVGLDRAKAYYRARLESESGASSPGNPKDVADSVARRAFYRYALATVSQGGVARSSSGTEVPHLKYLAHGMDEFRKTGLYDEQVYPISKKGRAMTLHAYSGCPACAKQGIAGRGAVSGIEKGTYLKCGTCQFSLNNLQRVSSLTTGHRTGFEKHYRDFVEASNRYRDAIEASERLRDEVEVSTGRTASRLKKLLKSLAGQRYHPQPPGRYGCICIVVSPRREHAGLPFLRGSSSTPARVAISGATLAHESSSQGQTVVSDIAAGLIPEEATGPGALRAVIGSWSDMLQAYTDANKGVEKAVNVAFGAVPVIGDDLASNASSVFKNAIKDVGLEPGDLNTYKPALVNTSEIAQTWSDKQGSPAADALLKLKDAAGLYSEGAELTTAGQARDLGTLLDTFEDCDGVKGLVSNKGLTLATMPLSMLLGNVEDNSITISAPENLADACDAACEAVASILGR